jgi:hypothetical protein
MMARLIDTHAPASIPIGRKRGYPLSRGDSELETG